MTLSQSLDLSSSCVLVGVLTVALAQFLAEQLFCELGKECGILLPCRQAVRLCGAAGKPQGGQRPIGKCEMGEAEVAEQTEVGRADGSSV